MIGGARRFLMAVLTVLLVASATRIVRAQEGEPRMAMTYQTSGLTVQALQVAERKTRRGRNVLIASSVFTAGGITMLGMASPNLWFGSAPRGLVAAGAVAVAAGSVGLIVGGILLADGKRAKREIERSRPELLLGLTGARMRLRF